MAVHFLNNETEKLFKTADKALYRVMTVDRLFEILEKNRWGFVSPTLWNDPYEKAFIDAEYHSDGTKFYLPIKPKLVNNETHYSTFAMCWSETRESEAFWKTYTPNSDGVKIAVWARDLLTALKGIKDYDVYIGKAKYETFEKLYEFNGNSEFWNNLKSKKINKQHLNLLLKKRHPFSYEKEIRIILVRRKTMTKEIAKLSIANSKNLIHSYKFDPRMGSYIFKTLKEQLTNKFEIRDNIIRQSNLYKKPNGTITFKEM